VLCALCGSDLGQQPLLITPKRYACRFTQKLFWKLKIAAATRKMAIVVD
jgi:hypothetical protein